MNKNKPVAQRAAEIVAEMNDLLEEFKTLARSVMNSREYESFKYNTLGHIEPALLKETIWYTNYSSVCPLERVAENMAEEEDFDEDEEEE